MFAADAGTRSSSLRGTRRRPRTASITTNSLAAPRTKKLRSGLLDDRSGGTSVASDEDMTNGSISGRLSFRRRPVDNMDSKRSSLRETHFPKADTGRTLLKNDNFSVMKLPAFPEKVRNSMKENTRAALSTSSSFALFSTRTHALVWSYAQNSSAPDVFSFTIPSPSARTTDPAPLGCLISPTAASTEPGLVIVVPTTGRIAFWESASSAAAQDLFRQNRNNVEGQVSLMSGETVTSIVSAEPAGYCLTFSSGRLAHLNVRDADGRPMISVQVLRQPTSSSGIFGSFKNLIVSGWKKEFVAAKPGRHVGRGERQILGTTEGGQFQRWTVNRNGSHVFLSELEINHSVFLALKEHSDDLQSHDKISILDFELLQPKENMALQLKSQASSDNLLILVTAQRLDATRYFLVEASLEQENVRILKVHAIRNVRPQGMDAHISLQLPAPQTTAYIVFPRSVVVFSLPGSANSPDMQLMSDLPAYRDFQDIINLRDDTQVQIIASAGLDMEARDEQSGQRISSCVLLVKEGGLLRINAFGQSADLTRIQEATAKSHLEQAVFFGSPTNLIDFSLSLRSFSSGEIENAALAVGADILNSSSTFIPTLQPSMDYQLKQRKNYSHKLITFLRENSTSLSRVTKWRLLWDAEKLAAARAIWKHCDAKMKQSEGDETMVNYIFRAMSNEYRTVPDASKGESDDTRQWLIHDVNRIEHAIYSALEAVTLEHQYKSTKKADLLEECAEVTEVILLSLETAFAFRMENYKLYGLQDEKIEAGIVQEGLGSLPPFWTSSENILAAVQQLPEYNYALVDKYYRDVGQHQPEFALLHRIIDLMPSLEEVMILVMDERARWLGQQSDPALESQAKEVAAEQVQLRQSHLSMMMTFGKSKEAMTLAEKHHDFKQLCELLERRRSDLQSLLRKGVLSDNDRMAAQSKINTITQHEDFLFEKYKEPFAKAFYTSKIERQQIASLVRDAPRREEIYGQWVDHDPRFWKLKWINEIEQGRSDEASKRMMHYALGYEQNLWSKKVELSLGKLTQLISASKTNSDRDNAWNEEYDKKIQNVEIQESLYQHILPFIRAGSDENNEVQLAMIRFGKKLAKTKSASRSLLESGFRTLIRREAMTPTALIDVLTLMETHVDPDEPGNMLGFEFSYALRVLERSMLKGEVEQLMLKMIWRRCFIRDNWIKLSETSSQADEMVERSLSFTSVGKTLLADQRLGPDTSMIVSPEEALGAGTRPDELHGLYPPEKSDKLAQELSEEDKILRTYIEKGQLEKWFPGIKKWAVDHAGMGIEG